MRFKLFIAFCLVCSQFKSFAQVVNTNGKLHVQGNQLLNEHNVPVVLRGMSFGWHCFWPRFYNENVVHTLHKDWGCTIVRAAMGVEPKKGYIDNPEWSTEKIKAVVDAAIKEGIYVIIDWHSHNIRQDEAKKFFSEMSAAYGKYPNVIYEIFNEPDQETWPEVKAYSSAIIQTIRANDPDNIILVGTPHWDQDIQEAAKDPLTGVSNIMYTVHYYAATHKQDLRDRSDKAYQQGIPIFISESAGMEASGDGPINDEEWQKWINWAEERKISWITWSVSDKDETCSVLQQSADSNGSWKSTDLKESGKKIKAILNGFANK